MSNAYPVKTVANTFLQRDFEDGVATISPMKLQKLVYCLHGWHLAITGKPAITGSFDAWQYGPVQDELYHSFKQFRDKPINRYASVFRDGEEKAFVIPSNDDQMRKIFEEVSKKYMPFSALQLSALTHQSGTPWSKTMEHGGGTISDDEIRKHFLSIVK
ncbi:MAG: type II toxin-antitoxin system antitoxin SocA domain-containing protein [Pseudomonadota bacterium]